MQVCLWRGVVYFDMPNRIDYFKCNGFDGLCRRFQSMLHGSLQGIIMTFKFFSLTFIFLLTISNSPATQDIAAACDSCTDVQKLNLAVKLAKSDANPGVNIYIADFTESRISKYYVQTLKDGDTSPAILESDAVVKKHLIETESGNFSVSELQIAPEVSDGFSDLAAYVDYLESNGVHVRRDKNK